MRLSLAAASLAISVALLAGCSSSSQGTLPGGSSQAAASHGVAMPSHLSMAEGLKLRPNVLRPGAKAVSHEHMLHVKIDKTAKPKMVITDDGGYIWWLSKKGTVTGYTTDCSGAEGGVVDHKGRLVVACTNSGNINIYNKGNTTGPADVVLSENTSCGSSCFNYYYPASAFEDKNGNIYATNLYGYLNNFYNFAYGSIAWWTTSNQTTGSFPSGSYTDPNLYEDFFGDIDSNGTVYVDGYNFSFVSEVDSVSNITQPSASATNTGIALNFQGLIYAMGNGNLAIGDQGTYGAGNNALYIYNDPPTAVSATLTSPQNIAHTCDPVAGGFSKGDSSVLIGDAGCRAGDLGKVSANTWKNVLNINFITPIGGMFLKSDK